MSDQYTFVVTVHGQENNHVAEYEVRADAATSAIMLAATAYVDLTGFKVKVCEVRLYNALDAVRKFSATFDRAMGRVAPETNDDLSDIGEYTLADIAQSRRLVTLAVAYLAQDTESDTSGVDVRQSSTGEGDDCRVDDDTLPGWEWAVEHGYSTKQAWARCAVALERLFMSVDNESPDKYISDLTGIPYDVVRETTDHSLEYLRGHALYLR